MLFQLMHQLLTRGVPRQDILYINFFDDRLHSLPQAGLHAILEAYFALYPDKRHTDRLYCFFDEIQAIPNWEPFVERLLRTENCSIYITGSSAQLLSREIATQMRGRALSWELFPFSFREFLDYQDIAHQGPLTSRQELRIQHAFTSLLGDRRIS